MVKKEHYTQIVANILIYLIKRYGGNENVYGTVAFSTVYYWSSQDLTYPAWVYGDYKDANRNQQKIIFDYVEKI